MSKKIMMLAASVVAALAFAAMPALASADPSVDTPEPHFNISGGTAELKSGQNIHCTSVSGSGDFSGSAPYSTGTVQFIFHGCTALSKLVTCGEGGTITTTVLPFHLKTVSGDPAILVTSKEGHFASFSCAGIINVKVTGNGIIGTVTNPPYNTLSNTFETVFSESGGAQAHTKVDGDSTVYGLLSSIGGGTPEPAREVASGQGAFSGGAEGELTE